MGELLRRNIEDPHETRKFQAHGYLDVVTLGEFTLGRGVFEPGWRWSNDVKPIAGTDACMAHHTGMVVSGSMTVRSSEGVEETFSTGDVFMMEPGHDAWVNGAEPCILIDTSAAAYAKQD